jgi:SAM-dependent methyltransferase
MAQQETEDARVRDGYAARAVEYTELFGDIAQMDDVDRERIGRWADGVDGRILDVGCGPGHWTAFLVERGADAEGIDLVPDFIAGASARFPHISYRTASLADADIPLGSLGGVLAWYSLIHATPDGLPHLLEAARRGTREGGHLLVGFFDGADGQPFPHAVTTAHYWSVQGMSNQLERAGFSVLDSETRVQERRRPHASISAVAI